MADETPGDWLRGEMERRGLTAADVASAAGVKSTQAVYTWLNGKSTPKAEAIERIASLLDISVAEVRQRMGLWVNPETSPSRRQANAELKQALQAATDALAQAQEALARVASVLPPKN
jgi:transcriptional regulator with XRE-family HTH domain